MGYKAVKGRLCRRLPRKKRQAARQLLSHLVQLAGSSIYEDDSISICRQGEEILCRLAGSASCTIAHADGHTLVALRPKT